VENNAVGTGRFALAGRQDGVRKRLLAGVPQGGNVVDIYEQSRHRTWKGQQWEL
jgi:hypothetical protein